MVAVSGRWMDIWHRCQCWRESQRILALYGGARLVKTGRRKINIFAVAIMTPSSANSRIQLPLTTLSLFVMTDHMLSRDDRWYLSNAETLLAALYLAHPRFVLWFTNSVCFIIYVSVDTSKLLTWSWHRSYICGWDLMVHLTDKQEHLCCCYLTSWFGWPSCMPICFGISHDICQSCEIKCTLWQIKVKVSWFQNGDDTSHVRWSKCSHHYVWRFQSELIMGRINWICCQSIVPCVLLITCRIKVKTMYRTHILSFSA